MIGKFSKRNILSISFMRTFVNPVQAQYLPHPTEMWIDLDNCLKHLLHIPIVCVYCLVGWLCYVSSNRLCGVLCVTVAACDFYHFATHNYQVVSCSGQTWWRGLLEQSRNDGAILETEYLEYLFHAYSCQPIQPWATSIPTSPNQSVNKLDDLHEDLDVVLRNSPLPLSIGLEQPWVTSIPNKKCE